MRTGVLTFEQHSESSPEHFISKPLSEKFLFYRHGGKVAAVRISASLIWIRVKLSFAKLKALLRRPDRYACGVSEINAPGEPEGLLLSYPLPDQTSFRRPIFRICS